MFKYNRIVLSIYLSGLLGLTGCGFEAKVNFSTQETYTYSASIEPYQSCQELQNDIAEMDRQEQLAIEAWKTNNNQTFQADGVTTSMPSHAEADMRPGSPTPAGGITNLINQDVDEGDIVKAGAWVFAFSRPDSVEIVDLQSLEIFSSIPTSGILRPSLYLVDNTLIIIGKSYIRVEQSVNNGVDPSPAPSAAISSDEAFSPENPSFPNYQQSPISVIRSYDISNPNQPVKLHEQVINGDLVKSRRIKNTLFVITDNDLNLNTLTQDNKENCQNIYKRVFEDNRRSTTTVTALNIQNHSSRSITLLGGTDLISMTPNNLYLLKNNFRPFSYQASNLQKTLVKKISLQTPGLPVFQSVGLVEGKVKDAFGIKEMENSLVLVTHTNRFKDRGDDPIVVTPLPVQPPISIDSNSSGPTLTASITNEGPIAILPTPEEIPYGLSNHIFVLQEKEDPRRMQIRSQYTGFGQTEDVRSARFVKDMLYVVTFKKTDPLFAFNLSNLDNLQLMGELKIPGFSTYMHPINDRELIGVGFDASDQGNFALFQGVQVSLFDVSNPLAPKRSDVKVHGVRESSSLATHDHHAFHYNEEYNIVSLPVIELVEKVDHVITWTREQDAGFMGSLLYRPENGQLKLLAKISHRNFYGQQCDGQNWNYWWSSKSQTPDIERQFVIGNKLFAFSKFGVSSHSLSNFQTLQSASFSGPTPCKDKGPIRPL